MLSPKPSVAACADCHVVPSDMTAQCTEQCVVVACSDQEPDCESVCPGNHCDLVCEDASGCKDCKAFDDFLPCCTDFHSYYEEPRNYPDISTPWYWDPVLKTFVCPCAGDDNMMDCVPPDATGAPVPMPDLSAPPPHSVSVVPETIDTAALTCMWGNCGAAFTSLPDLADHVYMMHLLHPPPPQQVFPTSCQWKDCTIYPTADSIPGPSSCDVDSMLGVLSSHLLHDHLGLSALPTKPQPPHSSEFFHLDEQPVARSVSQTPSVSSLSTSSAEHDTYTCRWLSCAQSFGSLDDLTQHLINIHVGAGKTSYDCHWQDCSRHGESGFSSKQKLCRHLQSHTGHRPFQCKVCMQLFSEAATLQQHMRRHTQEKPYLCDYPGCGKSFAIAGALTIHKRTHNGDKPFRCPHCDRQVGDCGERPYACTEPGCNKAFARADQLTRHNRVHKKVSNS
ncbi:hypothetical protein GGX14DRAFT_650186 [Mycena pura]|uniref:C2H2-type domain-containing protein n=1 Tax=Mycena pura TaxID=153505 RepID=A0AAD6YNB7_9AGAR|nr:hypothetical protein GGX14DRAFT_650186 [Mycena pura]